MAAAARHGSSPRPPGRPAAGGPRVAAAARPVARVIVDVSLAHLDRPFDYLVPEQLDATAVPGCRVRIRFAGRLAGGYLLERAEASDHAGGLAYLERVVSPEPVLTPEIAGLARAVADRYGGTMADVLRLAVPPRHAAAESEPAPAGAGGAGGAERAVRAGQADGAGEAGGDRVSWAGGPGEADGMSDWARYGAGPSFLAAIAAGRAPRAIWSALPGPGWPAEIAAIAATAVEAGRGVVIVVPDVKDLRLVDAALTAALGSGRHVSLSAGLGPAERYRRWLAVLRDRVRVACGTRSAMFAPVARLGLVVVWDDGDDLHAEPRAPYPHARDVLALRAHRCGAAALIGGFARTTEAQQLLAAGWARPLEADRAVIRRHAPLISATGYDTELERDEAARSARLPSLAIRTARQALGRGPVLFQVPRHGYLVSVCCEHCRMAVRCARCGGPVALAAAGAGPACRWCGHDAGPACAQCGHARLRALVTGSARTAEELGRAFPGVPVLTSGRAGVRAQVPASPAVVVATPGAEPHADGGYAAAVLLDGWALLGRASLRAGEETLRRWMNAAALVRPGHDGGAVIAVADGGLAVVQALIRWDPAGFADRELGERTELGFPPAVRMAAVSGPADAVAELVDSLGLPPEAEVLGPVSDPGGSGAGTAVPAVPSSPGGADGDPGIVRYLIQAPRREGTVLAAALAAGQQQRSARKDQRPVRIQLDPAELI